MGYPHKGFFNLSELSLQSYNEDLPYMYHCMLCLDINKNTLDIFF